MNPISINKCKKDKRLANIRYVIISPIRNEGHLIEKTIKSVVSQTVKPVKWVIVNDGSTDNTRQIIEKYIEKYGWIKLVNLPDRGFRKQCVASVLPAGLNLINIDDYDFIVKLDGDLSFESTYFEELFTRFVENSKLGIASGSCYNLVKNRLVLEKVPQFHVRGASKVYRRECWQDIGGLVEKLGWDTVDEIKAQMLGWKTQSFRELKVIHYRKTGSAGGMIRGKISYGQANYFAGYHPLFMILKAIKHMVNKPYLIGGIIMIYSFFRGYILKLPQIKDPQLIRYLRRQQINRLIFRKTIWK